MVRHIPGLAEKAATRSLNTTVNKVIKYASQIVAEEMGATVSGTRRAMFKIKAERHNLKASIIAKGKRLNLKRFQARRTKSGISAVAWGKRKVYKGSFIGNNGRTVFARKSGSRLPIKPLWGPSIKIEMMQAAVIKAMTLKAGELWTQNFNRDMRFYLSRAKY